MTEFSRHTVAVVGYACRMPGAPDADAFWTVLDEQRCTISPEGSGRWSNERFLHPRMGEAGRSYTFASGVLPDIYAFDHGAFGLSPREVEQMDPQQRILLELTREALDDMNCPAGDLAGKPVGVFVGASAFDHTTHFFSDIASAGVHFVTGSALSIIANRISHIYGFTGPSLMIDTACSSSLVALDRAVRAIEQGELDTAIVGSVNMLASPFNFVGFSLAGMLSPTGLCRPFSAEADGYVRSEGAAILVLRRLDSAKAAGQTPRAVILGSGVNSDGHTVGIVFPATRAQQRLVETIYDERAIDVDALSFVEAHGTGTRVGDPAEARALGTAIGQKRNRPLPIGSVKSNIGHLEPASGLAGMIKAMLALKHRRLPASLHLNAPNEAIPFEELNLLPAREAIPLTETGGPLSAGVSSFGFGGTNAHVVFRLPMADEIPAPPGPADGVNALTISAHSRPALEALATRYAEQLQSSDSVPLAQAAAYGRDLLPHRLVAPLDSERPLHEILTAFAEGQSAADVAYGRADHAVEQIAFVFSGNGSQFVGMGEAAYRTDSDFRASIDSLDAIFAPLAGWSLAEAIRTPVAADRLASTAVAQPLIFAIEVAIAECLIKAGCRPAMVLGHSVGEIAAAHVAGCLDRENAVRLIHWRSHWQNTTRGLGSMLALMQTPDQAESLIGDLGLSGVSVAAVNSPTVVSLAGPKDQIESLQRAAKGRRLAAKSLGIDYPFHSALMDPIEDELLRSLATLKPRSGTIPFISTVTGAVQDGLGLDAGYWWRNVRRPVQFQDAVSTAIALQADLFIEITPRPLLNASVRDILAAADVSKPVLGTLDKSDVAGGKPIARCILQCFAHGVPIDKAKLFGVRPGILSTALPAYPWQRTDSRPPNTQTGIDIVGLDAPHPLLGQRLNASSNEWLGLLDTALVPYLADHRVNDTTVVPGAALAEMALAAGRELFGDVGLMLEDFDIVAALVLRPDLARETLVRVSSGRTIDIFSRERGRDDWSLHARGRIGQAQIAPDRATAPSARGARIDGALLYARAARLGLAYGPQFRLVRTARRSGSTIDIDLDAPDAAQGAYRVKHVLHPVSLDAAFHGLLALFDGEADGDTRVFLPVRFGRLDIRSSGVARRAVVTIKRASTRSILADFLLLDADDAVVASLVDARFKWTVLASAAAERPAFLQRLERIGGDAEPNVPDALAEFFETGEPAQPADDRILLQAFAQAIALETVGQLTQMRNGGQVFDVEALIKSGHVSEQARNLSVLLAHSLQQAGIAEAHGDVWIIDPAAALPESSTVLRTILAAYPDCAAEVAIASRIGAELLDVVRTGRPLAGATGILDHFMTASPTFGGIAEVVTRMCGALANDVVADRPQVLVLESHGALGRALLPLVRKGRVRLVVEDATAVGHRSGRKAAARLPRLPGLSVGLDDAKRLGTRFDLLVVLDQDGSADFGQIKQAVAALRPGAPVVTIAPAADAFVDLLLAVMPDPAAPERLAPRSHRTKADQIDRLRAAGLSRPSYHVVVEARTGFTAAVAYKARSEGQAGVVQAVADALQSWLASSQDTLALDLGDKPSETGEARTERLPPGSRLVTLHKQPAVSAKQMTERLARRIDRAAELLDAVRSSDDRSEVWFLTHGAHPAPRRTEDPSEAGFWGFGRVAMNEYADLDVRLVDVAHGSTAHVARVVATLLCEGTREKELVITEGGLRAVRVEQARPVAPPEDPSSRAAILDLPLSGSLSRLAWRSGERRAPARGEIEIAVKASALNFRDVMFAQGLLSDDMLENGFAGPTLGFECSGIVERVGDGVTTLKVGDRVMAFASAAFSSHVTVHARAVVALPEAMDLVAAATMPVAFLTVWYGLDHLARLKRGETVLIHGAAGGVGMAAIQIARLKGARIVATAGSPEKRALARLLGATHVFDSRTQAFADDVMRAVGGVDVVLNSLAGEAMERSLKLLKPFGRFVELGKRDYVANSEIGLRPFARNLTYFGVDADQLIAADPQLVPRMFRKIRRLIDAGSIRPLPYRSYVAEDAPDAFRLMQSGGHVGKILVMPPTDMPARTDAPVFAAAADGVHLVVGGTGGFGFETAVWLADHGARKIVLASRTGALGTDAQARVDRLAERGVAIEVQRLDARNRAETLSFLNGLETRYGRVCGVVHAAMVLHDALIRDLDQEHLRDTLAPKVQGALNLDEATRARGLDYFVLYSSATTLIGNPGQAAYVAANSVMESIARQRRARGLPALAVGWGPITDVGVLARNAAVSEKLQRRIGAIGLRSEEALAWLGQMLADDYGKVPPVLTYAPLDFGSIAELPAVKSPMFADLVQSAQASPDQAPAGDLSSLIANKSDSDAQAALGNELAKEIGRILHLPPAEIDHRRPLSELGMDSLMGLELEMEVQRRFGVQLPVLSLSAGATLADIAGTLLKRLRSSDGSGAAEAERDDKVVMLALATRHLGSDVDPERVEELRLGMAADTKRIRQGGVIR